MTALDDPANSAEAIATASEAETPASPSAAAGITRFVGPAAVFGLFIAFWYFAHHVLMSEPKKPLVPVPHRVVQDSILTWNIMPIPASLAAE